MEKVFLKDIIINKENYKGYINSLNKSFESEIDKASKNIINFEKKKEDLKKDYLIKLKQYGIEIVIFNDKKLVKDLIKGINIETLKKKELKELHSKLIAELENLFNVLDEIDLDIEKSKENNKVLHENIVDLENFKVEYEKSIDYFYNIVCIKQENTTIFATTISRHFEMLIVSIDRDEKGKLKYNKKLFKELKVLCKILHTNKMLSQTEKLDIIDELNGFIESTLKNETLGYETLNKIVQCFYNYITNREGIYLSIPDIKYREMPNLNWSKFKRYIELPIRYTEHEKKETKALKEGSFIHTVVLEPDLVDERYFLQPEEINGEKYSANKNDHKAYLKATYEDKEKIDRSLWNMAYKIKNKILEDQKFKQLLKNSYKEVVVIWCENINGEELWCKGKIDILDINYKKNSDVIVKIVDFKTTSKNAGVEIGKEKDVSSVSWAYDYDSYLYFGQGCFYKKGVLSALKKEKIKIYVGFIVSEKTYPYLCKGWKTPPEVEKLGMNMINKNLEKFMKSQKTNIFNGYKSGFDFITIPSSRMKKYEEYL